MAFVYEKRIPFGEDTEDVMKQEKEAARQAGIEFSFVEMPSYYLIQVETDDQGKASTHKLISTGYIVPERNGDDADSR